VESDCTLPKANERASEPEVMVGNVVEDKTKGDAGGNGEDIVHGQKEPNIRLPLFVFLYSHVINSISNTEYLVIL